MAKAATLHDLRRALILPQAEICTIRWELVTDELRFWTGGMIDGDGCISADIKHGLRVSVKQAELGWLTLYRLQEMYGGQVHLNKEACGTHQAQKTWYLSGRNALFFCREMQNYVHLKRAQMQAANSYPIDELKFMQMTPVESRNPITRETQMFGSVAYAKSVVPALGSLNFALKDPAKRAGGRYWTYAINPVTAEETLKKQAAAIMALKQLKKIEHEAVVETLHLSYIAGLIDSDGSIDMSGDGNRRLCVAQKYIAICEALKVKFDSGGICRNKKTGVFMWKVNGTSAVHVLTCVAPYLIEKREQAKIILGATAGEAISVRARLRLLKGNQGPRPLI